MRDSKAQSEFGFSTQTQSPHLPDCTEPFDHIKAVWFRATRRNHSAHYWHAVITHRSSVWTLRYKTQHHRADGTAQLSKTHGETGVWLDSSTYIPPVSRLKCWAAPKHAKVTTEKVTTPPHRQNIFMEKLTSLFASFSQQRRALYLWSKAVDSKRIWWILVHPLNRQLITLYICFTFQQGRFYHCLCSTHSTTTQE